MPLYERMIEVTENIVLDENKIREKLKNQGSSWMDMLYQILLTSDQTSVSLRLPPAKKSPTRTLAPDRSTLALHAGE